MMVVIVPIIYVLINYRNNFYSYEMSVKFMFDGFKFDVKVGYGND